MFVDVWDIMVQEKDNTTLEKRGSKQFNYLFQIST